MHEGEHEDAGRRRIVHAFNMQRFAPLRLAFLLLHPQRSGEEGQALGGF